MAKKTRDIIGKVHEMSRKLPLASSRHTLAEVARHTSERNTSKPFSKSVAGRMPVTARISAAQLASGQFQGQPIRATGKLVAFDGSTAQIQLVGDGARQRCAGRSRRWGVAWWLFLGRVLSALRAVLSLAPASSVRAARPQVPSPLSTQAPWVTFRRRASARSTTR